MPVRTPSSGGDAGGGGSGGPLGLEHLRARVHTVAGAAIERARGKQKKRPDRGVSGRHYCSFRSERSGEPVGETGSRPPTWFRGWRRKHIAFHPRTQKTFARRGPATGPESACSRKRDEARRLFRRLCHVPLNRPV